VADGCARFAAARLANLPGEMKEAGDHLDRADEIVADQTAFRAYTSIRCAPNSRSPGAATPPSLPP
jgi:hypothetical protein